MFRHKRPFYFAACLLTLLTYLVILSWQARISIPTLHQPISFYSPQLGQNLEQVVLSFIEKARFSISIASYGFTSKKVAIALCKVALRGVHVELILDAKNIQPSHLKLLGPDVHIRKVKAKGLMHRKWLIIDHQLVFLSTANMTNASLCIHDNFAVGFYCPSMAEFLEGNESSGLHNATFDFGAQKATLWLLPDKGEAFDHLLHARQNAHSNISVALFTFTHPRLMEAIGDGLSRGLSIEMLIDGQSGRGASWKMVKEAYDLGIDPCLSVGTALFHHKVAQVDDKLFVGSANWTRAAFKTNMDDLLLITPLTAAQKKQLHAFWKRARQQTVSLSCLPDTLAAKAAA